MRTDLLALSLLSTLACKGSVDKGAGTSENAQLEVFRKETKPPQPRSRPAWLKATPACPSKLLPKHYEEPNFSLEACAGELVDGCLAECQQGSASQCYASALTLQTETTDGDASVVIPLFARACELGNASACTNWAASFHDSAVESLDCLRNTFESACRLGQDPWACTMLGRMLVDDGADDSTVTTLQGLMPIACRHGEEDQACTAMRDVLKAAGKPSAADIDAGPH